MNEKDNHVSIIFYHIFKLNTERRFPILLKTNPWVVCFPDYL